MLGFSNPPAASPNAAQNPFADFAGMGGFPAPGAAGTGLDGAPPNDPMMAMLQQMMSGAGGAGGMPDFSSAFSGSGAFPGFGGGGAAADPYAYVWRIVHAVFALGLGIYIAMTTSFTGTRLAREKSALAYSTSSALGESEAYRNMMHIFYIFATAEVILQTTRFYLDKARGTAAAQGGILGMVGGFLPEPYAGYVRLFGRYAKIWGTVSGDAVVAVFVLGLVAWWKGM